MMLRSAELGNEFARRFIYACINGDLNAIQTLLVAEFVKEGNLSKFEAEKVAKNVMDTVALLGKRGGEAKGNLGKLNESVNHSSALVPLF
jgi:hypothetical protein